MVASVGRAFLPPIPAPLLFLLLIFLSNVSGTLRVPVVSCPLFPVSGLVNRMRIFPFQRV